MKILHSNCPGERMRTYMKKTNRSLEISPKQIYIKERWLKVANMRTNKRILKRKFLLSDISGKYIMEFLTGEAPKGYNNKNLRQNIKKDKYAQMKRFTNNRQIQFYMYDLI